MIPFFEDLWTRIAARLGSSTDAAGTSTVFARLNQIYTGLSTLKKDMQMQVFTSSGSFYAPKTGYYRVRCQASGGTVPSSIYLSGAGGYCEGTVYLSSNQYVSVSVSSSAGQNASFGGYMTATAGSNALTYQVAPGGTAYGGSINIPGQPTTNLNWNISGTGTYGITLLGSSPLAARGFYVSEPSGYNRYMDGGGYGMGGYQNYISPKGGIVIVEWVE